MTPLGKLKTNEELCFCVVGVPEPEPEPLVVVELEEPEELDEPDEVDEEVVGGAELVVDVVEELVVEDDGDVTVVGGVVFPVGAALVLFEPLPTQPLAAMAAATQARCLPAQSARS